MSATASDSGQAQQRALYGEPLGNRFDRITAAYGITRGRLASVLGLSPAMLSQLASGQRVKISNPAVYARLLRLDELQPALDPTGSGTAAQDVLASISASHLELTTRELTTRPRRAEPATSELLVTLLADSVPYPELRDAASRTSGVLHDLIHRAAEHADDYKPDRAG